MKELYKLCNTHPPSPIIVKVYITRYAYAETVSDCMPSTDTQVNPNRLISFSLVRRPSLPMGHLSLLKLDLYPQASLVGPRPNSLHEALQLIYSFGSLRDMVQRNWHLWSIFEAYVQFTIFSRRPWWQYSSLEWGVEGGMQRILKIVLLLSLLDFFVNFSSSEPFNWKKVMHW